MTGPAWLGGARRLAARRLALGLGVAGRWAVVLPAALFGAAAATVLLRQPLAQNADGLIQTLFSVQRLTLFFWGQDRFANLLPALASPVRDPHVNALVQVALRTVLGLMAPLFVCMMVLNRPGAAWRATLAASALLLALAPQRMIHEAFIEASPYGTSFALAGFALLALHRAGRAAGGQAAGAARAGLRLLAAGLACAAYLVNASLVLVAGPLLLGEALLFGSALAVEFGVASLIGGGVAWLAMLGAATDEPTSRAFGSTLIGLTYYGQQLVGKQGAFLSGVVLASALLPLLLRRCRSGPGARAYYWHGAILAAVLLATFVAVSLSDWVVLNDMHPRYMVPHFFLAAAMGGLCLAHLVCGVAPGALSWRMTVLAACAGLLAVGARRTPPPSPSWHEVVDPAQRPVADAVAAAVLSRSLDVVAGDYWDVWPAVFQAEQAAHDAGRPGGQVLGAAYRGQVRRDEAAMRLLAKGRLEVACIAIGPQACAASLASVMELPIMEPREVGTPATLPDGRLMSFIVVEPRRR